MKQEERIQRNIGIPLDVDDAIKGMMTRDPDLSYSAAARKVLRAGIRVMGQTKDIESGQTQLNPQFMEAARAKDWE
jgi:hypothetical protein